MPWNWWSRLWRKYQPEVPGEKPQPNSAAEVGWIPLDATVSGQTYALGDVVELDGKHFVGCVFGEGCVLRYRGGEVFSIQQSAFSSQIRVEFATPDLLHSALLVAQLQTLYAQTEDGGGLEVGMVDEERLSANVYYEGTA